MQLNYVDAPGAVPASYTLPASQSFEVESVSASFDGTGAGGDFLACLAFYSQDGKLIGRFPAPTAFTAGDTGEVSFAPLAEDSASSPPSSGTSLATCAAVSFGGAFTGGTIAQELTFNIFATNDSAVFAKSGGGYIEITGTGTFLVWGEVTFVTGPLTYTRFAEIQFSTNGGSTWDEWLQNGTYGTVQNALTAESETLATFGTYANQSYNGIARKDSFGTDPWLIRLIARATASPNPVTIGGQMAISRLGDDIGLMA